MFRGNLSRKLIQTNGEISVRLLICAGGTGGGVYPALAVHNALKAIRSDVETLWVGGEGGMEARLVERASIPFKTIPAAGVHGVDLKELPGNLNALSRGVFASRDILDEFKPDVLFFTGGYVAVPMALAGRKLPSLLYVPDIEPGLALKSLSYFATRIILTAEESKQYFANRTNMTVTGYPIRPELMNWKKPVACKRLGIKSELPVVLVFGGSKGAHSINLALFEHLTTLLEQVEIVHISGELDWPSVEEKCATLTPEQVDRYHAFSYLHEDMGAALAAADLVVSRAGASVLGEYPLFGIPAILVPYPFAWRYQKVNADTLARHGAALMIEDAKLKSGLYLTIEKLLETPEKLEVMRKAMLALRAPDAASKIAAQLCELAGEKK
jgi:UDP-N-acetylglucosamine--N-acetylmuramyl-(pentapeptide) pyrophosphoryl-undecaprenol N-acetylglucosamine transferase